MQKESHLEIFNHYNSTILEYLSFCLIMLVMTSQMHTCFDTGEIFFIEDIRDVRFHKVETGLEKISGRISKKIKANQTLQT